jgi:hypothetical protein
LYSYDYIERLPDMKVSPSEVSISNLDVFDESLAEASFSASEVLEMLQ